MGSAPDEAMARMATLLAEGAGHLADAFASIRGTDATEPADAAVKSQRRLERVYREAMSALVQDSDPREVAARRELYRRMSRTSDNLVEVAERVWYSVLTAEKSSLAIRPSRGRASRRAGSRIPSGASWSASPRPARSYATRRAPPTSSGGARSVPPKTLAPLG